MEDISKFKVTPVTVNQVGTQAQLIVKTFALNSVRRQFFTLQQNPDLVEAELRATEEGNSKKYLSAFGLPVFDSLTFKAGSYLNDDDDEIFYGQVELGIALIEVTQAKRLVKTQIAGRAAGDVKEYISKGDYQLRIRGVIASGGQNAYPEAQVANLITICDVPEAVEVAGNIFQRFGIENIVIEQYTFPHDEAMRNVQRFEITAVSDTPFILKNQKII